jgi:hypothetical protein
MRYYLLVIFCATLVSCRDYTALESVPVVMSRAEVEASIKLESPREIRAPGATALAGRAMYIVEKYQGLHIVDNSNRSAPQRVGFIRIPGIWHVAVIGGHLITDNSRDILSFDISNSLSPSLQARAKNLLPDPPAKYYRSTRGETSLDSLVIDYRDTIVKGSMSLVS